MVRREWGFLLPLGLVSIFVVGILSVWVNHKLQDALTYERYAKETQARLDDLFERLQGAESAQRGYLLTGKREYLQAYQKDLPQIPLALKKLKSELAVLAIKNSELIELDQLVGSKLEELKLTVILLTSEKGDEAMAVIRTGRGEVLMNQIREALEKIDFAAKNLAQDHEEFAQKFATLLNTTILLGTVVTILLIAIFAFQSRKEIKRRIQNENELRAAQDAALAASKAKSQFLATVSHEVRTPLNGIIGMSDLMRRRITSGEERRFLDIIHSSGKALLQIVNEILDFSKVESGKFDIELGEFSILEVIEMAAGLFSAKAQEKNISVLTYVDGEIPKVVLGDSSRVSQIIRNLISNAIKFSHHRGTVLVSARLGFQSGQKSLIRFEVQDVGRGIQEGAQIYLFEPFNQIIDPHLLKQEGTGLGLSICKGLVEKMGGQIGVESQIGVGSKFWFELPFKKMSEEKLQLANRIKLKNKSVICVGRGLFERLLTLYSIELQFNLKCVDALALVDPHVPPDIILLQPTALTDEQFKKELKATANFPNAKIIFLGDNDQGCPGALWLKTPFTKKQFVGTLEDGKTTETEFEVQQTVKLDFNLNEAGLILVVDDNETNLVLSEILLNELGYRSLTVRNGHEALMALEQMTYDLILMDCQMPVMDGYQATKAIRNNEAKLGTHVPIVALTANTMPKDQQRCLDAGMDDYLTKPFDRDDLQKILKKWVRITHPGPIDWAVVQSLEQKTNRLVIKRIIDSFLQTLPKILKEIEEAKGRKNLLEIKHCVHRLRSSSAMLGATGLEKICLRMETQVEGNQEFESLLTDVEALAEIGNATYQALQQQTYYP